MNKIPKVEVVQKRITELSNHIVKMQGVLKDMELELVNLEQELLEGEDATVGNTIELELLDEFKKELEEEFKEVASALSDSRYDDCKEKLIQALGTAQMFELNNFSSRLNMLIKEVTDEDKNVAIILLDQLTKEIPTLGSLVINQSNLLDSKIADTPVCKEQVLDELQYEFLEELYNDLSDFLTHCKNKNALQIETLSNQHIGNAMLLEFSVCSKKLKELEAAAKVKAFGDMEKITCSLIEHVSQFLAKSNN